MRSHLLISLLLIYCFNSCHEKTVKSSITKDIYISSLSFQEDKIINELAHRFLDSLKGVSAIKEMTINRIYEDEYIISFRAKTNTLAYFNENYPLFVYKINNNDSIFIYSGIEPLIKGNNSNISANFIDSIPTYLCMRFLLKDGKYLVDQICNDPYFPPPKYIEPPEIDLEKFTPNSAN